MAREVVIVAGRPFCAAGRCGSEAPIHGPGSRMGGRNAAARFYAGLTRMQPDAKAAALSATLLAAWLLWAAHVRQRGIETKRLSVKLPEWKPGEETNVTNDSGDVMWRESYCFDSGHVRNAHDAFQILKQYYDDQHSHESFLVMFLGEDNRHLCTELFSKGGRSESFVDVNAIIKRAKQKGALSMYVAHNHPSNRLWPSKSDDEVTEALDKYCSRAGLRLHDHLILAREDFYSSRARRNSIDDPGLKQQGSRRVEQPPPRQQPQQPPQRTQQQQQQQAPGFFPPAPPPGNVSPPPPPQQWQQQQPPAGSSEQEEPMKFRQPETEHLPFPKPLNSELRKHRDVGPPNVQFSRELPGNLLTQKRRQ